MIAYESYMLHVLLQAAASCEEPSRAVEAFTTFLKIFLGPELWENFFF